MCMTFSSYLLLLSLLELSHFGLKAYMHWVSSESNSSYKFTWIFLKLCSNATPPTIHLDLFKTLQLFLSWSEDVHVIECNMDFLS